MSLDLINFKFQKHYVGFWYLPKKPHNNLSGTLYVEGQRIWIELFSHSRDISLPEYVEELIGTTYTVNNEGAKIATNIVVKELTFLNYCYLTNGLKYYTFEVLSMYICEGELILDKVTSIQLRSSIIDKWASPIMASSFHNEVFGNLPSHHFGIYYIQPLEYTLCRSNNLYSALKFYCALGYTEIDRSIEQKSFLYISGKGRAYPFEQMLTYASRVQNLFYILTNRIFSADYIYCESGCNNKFIYKINEQKIRRYINNRNPTSSNTTSNDFIHEEIQGIFTNWLKLYEDSGDAINMYFETLINSYLPFSSKIRNYVSVIDALTKHLEGEEEFAHKETKKSKFLEEIFNKYNLTPVEKNTLKMWILKEKKKELKPRLRRLFEKIGSYIPSNLDTNFIEKLVNTRNNITHPNTNETYCFLPDEYEMVVIQLSKIIRAYLLDELNIGPELIKKIL